MEHLLSASIGLGIFIIALMLGKKNRSIADHLLISWLSIITVNLISVFLLNTGEGDFAVWQLLLLEFSEASIFIHGPILYLYTRALTELSFSITPRAILHIVPFIIAFFLLAGPIFYGQEVESVLRNQLLIGKMISLLIYLLLVLKRLYIHKNKVADIFSNTEAKHLTWLFVVAWGILCIWIIAVGSLILDRFTLLSIPQYGGLLTNMAFSVFLFVIGYFGVRQPSLFIEYSRKSKRLPIEEKRGGKSKYEKSGLSEEQAIAIHKNAVGLMVDEKPYLDPELTLYALAERLQIPPNHLSQAINSIEKKNFFDFVNQYRIEQVKKSLRLGEGDHLTLLGIAFEAGFNSKASFNRAFKKFVGETPSQYRKGLSERLADR